MPLILNLISLAMLAVATGVALINVALAVVRHHDLWRRSARHVSVIPAVVPLLAWVAGVISGGSGNPWLPTWVFFALALFDIAFLLSASLFYGIVRRTFRPSV